MSRQNYYKQRHYRRSREVDEELILSLVRRERAVQPRLGTRKLLHILGAELNSAGVSVGRDRLFSILGRNSLLIKRRFRGYRTTDSCHLFRVYGNLLKDVFLTSPHQALVSDITYIRTDEGFMYLSLVMDAYSRAIVGYDCSDSLEADGTLRSLSMALRKLPSGSKTIHHSDRGSQYCCGAYVEKLRRRGLRISMTEENHCYENSQAERLNGILKQEYGLGGRFRSKFDVRKAVREAVTLYNCRRPHQSLGYRCPMEVHLAA
jgi:transposase InsO family protein